MRQIVKQVRERYKINLQSSDVNYQLWRLDDEEYRKLSQKRLYIEDDESFHEQINYSRNQQKNILNLAKLFVTLEYLFGKSSNLFDHDKGSCYFPILLVLNKEASRRFYLLTIFDSKGFVNFRLYKILDNSIKKEDDEQNIYSSFKKEPLSPEISHFLHFLYGYLVASFEVLKYSIDIPPFLKAIDAIWMTYGYQDNKYFEEDYDTEKDYQAAIDSFSDIYGNIWKNHINIDSILQKVISEVNYI